MKRTYALEIAYDGGAFRGWQKQPGMPTVQAAIEGSLRALVGKAPAVQGAARTDAGVHAERQVASFQSARDPDLSRLVLPDTVRLLRWSVAPASFHARASASGKRYRFRFAWAGDERRDAFFLGQNAAPDWERARAALRGLDGLPHLSGLCSPTRDHKPAPPLAWCSLSDDGVLEVAGKAFRKHEIRNLAGHLGAVALGLAEPGSLGELAARQRPWMGACAPAHGLTLVEVFYPPDLDPFRG